MHSVSIVTFLSGVVVLSFGLFLVGLAAVILARPSLAKRFLSSFASSARAHYTEQVVRLVVGTAMAIFAPLMWLPLLFRPFGWLLAVTAVGLLVLPWQWHHRFATRVMPPLMRRMTLFAIGAFALGAFILYGLSRVAGS